MQLADLHADQRTIAVPTAAGELKVTYRPSVVTPRFELNMSRKLKDATQAETAEAICEALAKVLTDWDLYNGDDVVPITTDAMLDLPGRAMMAILRAIQEDASQGEAEAPSGAG